MAEAPSEKHIEMAVMKSPSVINQTFENWGGFQAIKSVIGQQVKLPSGVADIITWGDAGVGIVEIKKGKARRHIVEQVLRYRLDVHEIGSWAISKRHKPLSPEFDRLWKNWEHGGFIWLTVIAKEYDPVALKTLRQLDAQCLLYDYNPHTDDYLISKVTDADVGLPERSEYLQNTLGSAIVRGLNQMLDKGGA